MVANQKALLENDANSVGEAVLTLKIVEWILLAVGFLVAFFVFFVGVL